MSFSQKEPGDKRDTEHPASGEADLSGSGREREDTTAVEEVDDFSSADETEFVQGDEESAEAKESGKMVGRKGSEHEKSGRGKHKAHKKPSTKDLVELLEKKNEMIQAIENKLLETEEELKSKEDKLLRMAAEFENYKKRTRREWDLLQKKANAELLTGLLGVLDDFDRAFEADDDPEDHFHSGIRMIYGQFMDIVSRVGLTEVAAEGLPFDPTYHEAVGEAQSDEVETGCVLHVVQKGYVLNDQLLRPARVIVASNQDPD